MSLRKSPRPEKDEIIKGFNWSWPRVGKLCWVGTAALFVDCGLQAGALSLGLLLCCFLTAQAHGEATAVRPLAKPLFLATAVTVVVSLTSVQLLSPVYKLSRRNLYEFGLYLPAIVESVCVLYCLFVEIFPTTLLGKQIASIICAPAVVAAVGRCSSVISNDGRITVVVIALSSTAAIAVVVASKNEIPVLQKRVVFQALALMPFVAYASSRGISMLYFPVEILDSVAMFALCFCGFKLGGGNLGKVAGLSVWTLVQYVMWIYFVLRTSYGRGFWHEQSAPTPKSASAVVSVVHTSLSLSKIGTSVAVSVAFYRQRNAFLRGLSAFFAFHLLKPCLTLAVLAWSTYDERLSLAPVVLALMPAVLHIVCSAYIAAKERYGQNFEKVFFLQSLTQSICEIELVRRQVLSPTAPAFSGIVLSLASIGWIALRGNDKFPLPWLSWACRLHVARVITCVVVENRAIWLLYGSVTIGCLLFPVPSTWYNDMKRDIWLRICSFEDVVATIGAFACHYIMYRYVIAPYEISPLVWLVVLGPLLVALRRPLAVICWICVLFIKVSHGKPAVLLLFLPVGYYLARTKRVVNYKLVSALSAVGGLLFASNFSSGRSELSVVLMAFAIFVQYSLIIFAGLSSTMPTYEQLVDNKMLVVVKNWLIVGFACLLLACVYIFLPRILPLPWSHVHMDVGTALAADACAGYAASYAILSMAFRLGDLLFPAKTQSWTSKLNPFCTIAAYVLGIVSAWCSDNSVENSLVLMSPILLFTPMPERLQRSLSTRHSVSARFFLPFAVVAVALTGASSLHILSEAYTSVESGRYLAAMLTTLFETFLLGMAGAGATYVLGDVMLNMNRIRQRGAAGLLCIGSFVPALLTGNSAVRRLSIVTAAACGCAAAFRSRLQTTDRRLV